MAHEIIATVKCMRDESGKICGCCNGRVHSYCNSLVIDFPVYPDHFEKTLNRWVDHVFDLETIEGRKIKITAEIVEGD